MTPKLLTPKQLSHELREGDSEDLNRRCAYCQTATLISIASLALAVPEALRALRGARA